MKIKTSLFAFLAIFLISNSSNAQTIDEIVAKHTEAMGGKENLDKLKSVYLESEINFGGMMIPVKMWRVDKKAMKVEFELQGMKGQNVVTDTSGWVFMPFQGQTKPEPMAKEDVKMSKSSLDLTGELVDYAAKGNKLEFLGKDEFEGTDVFKIQVVDKDGNISTDYVDVNTYYIIKTTSKRKIEDKEIESATIMSDFKKLDNGVVMPHSIDTGMGGALIVKKYEINPKIDFSIFEMPKN